MNKFSFGGRTEDRRQFRTVFTDDPAAVSTVKIDQPPGKRTTVSTANIHGVAAFEFAVDPDRTGRHMTASAVISGIVGQRPTKKEIMAVCLSFVGIIILIVL